MADGGGLGGERTHGRRHGHGGGQGGVRMRRTARAARGRDLAEGAAMADGRPCWHLALPRSPPATSHLLACLTGQ